jgi:hypothetical protein
MAVEKAVIVLEGLRLCCCLFAVNPFLGQRRELGAEIIIALAD